MKRSPESHEERIESFASRYMGLSSENAESHEERIESYIFKDDNPRDPVGIS